jgi:hypothetical protein
MGATVKTPELVAEREAVCRQSRDHELVRLLGRHGAMTMEQLMRAMGSGRTATYRRFARCAEAGLVERSAIPGVQSAVLHATREGLRYAGLGLPVAVISPSSIDHMLRCTSVAIRAGENLGHDRVLTEREIVLEEAIDGQPIASVVVGRFRGRPKKHRADLALLHEEGTIAVEVELTPKSPARLRRIIEVWASQVLSDRLHEVHYLCEPGQTHRAVERAVASAHVQGVIAVMEVPV